MPGAAQSLPEKELASAGADGAANPLPEGVEDALSLVGLSNDFLNHYSEILMLIEMAPYDPAIADDLLDWQPVSYRSYFGASELRRASAALAAYDALPDDRRQAFEKLVAAMDTLATMAVFALQPPSTPDTGPVIVEATVPALRGLIAKAGAFLNSGGRELAPHGETEEAQNVIDRILERSAGRDA